MFKGCFYRDYSLFCLGKFWYCGGWGDTLENQKVNKQAAISLILTIVLVIAALLVLFIGRSVQNLDLRISIFLFSLIDIGFLVAMILGTKTKHFGIRVLSVISNGIFFIALTLFTLALALAYGISEP